MLVHRGHLLLIVGAPLRQGQASVGVAIGERLVDHWTNMVGDVATRDWLADCWTRVIGGHEISRTNQCGGAYNL